MTDIQQISEYRVSIIVDTTIFNEIVISKVLYWLSPNFIIYRNSVDANHQNIILEQKQLPISPNEFENLKFKINQDFIDYQNREIINKETKDIRTILYIKAFANNDDFEDYNLITE
jgi:His-Xaa-Ser system protein HxsD